MDFNGIFTMYVEMNVEFTGGNRNQISIRIFKLLSLKGNAGKN